MTYLLDPKEADLIDPAVTAHPKSPFNKLVMIFVDYQAMDSKNLMLI